MPAPIIENFTNILERSSVLDTPHGHLVHRFAGEEAQSAPSFKPAIACADGADALLLIL
jgi:hypothetical protein